MEPELNKIKQNFLYPLKSYHGEFKPTDLAFNSNLQEFSQRVSYICNLESNGKIAPEDTYNAIKHLWHQLKQSKKELLDNPKFTLDK